MRTSGVLMPIFSLPSPYGIGTMGKEARKFVDFLVKGGQTYWQILPICPTSYGDSPYQSFSSFAGNPYFIDPDTLCSEKLLTKKECKSFDWGGSEKYIDYGTMYISRYALLRKAYVRFKKNIPDDYEDFCKKESGWLDEYALFMAIKDANDGRSWLEWDDELRHRDEKLLDEARVKYSDETGFYKMLQYLFFKQWRELKSYANERGIYIIGDVPIYVAADSADVWANPTQFYLDKNLNPIEVAGCPPDAFTADGQLWGNPLFRWDVMKKDNFRWWTKRMKAMAELYDIVRIDHFRGFDSYYAIPAKDKTARNGRWKKGPGMSLFKQIEKDLGKLPIIAEDLGFLTDSVYKLLKNSGFPGMKVLQFAFDSREGSNYLPHTYPTNCVVYTGTHDNDTSLGWMETAPKPSVQFAKDYLNLTEEEGLNWGMMRGAWSSVAELAIVPMQDIIGLGSEARINTPSTLGDNWKWRATAEQITPALAKRLYTYTEMYGRLSRTSLDEKAKKAAEKAATAKKKISKK
jgi:4-alpha-glucanotransferase